MAIEAEMRTGGDELDLERAFLIESVEQANIERVRCEDCGRVALVGEYLFTHRDGNVCELCHSCRHERAQTYAQVRYAGAELTVRRLQRC